jgi:hypothetical protein
VTHSTFPPPPPAIVAKIKAIEDELAVIWPIIKRRDPAPDAPVRHDRHDHREIIVAPFDHLPYDYKARIKWLLKRHMLLNTRDTSGFPTPRDWEVIITQDTKNPEQCYAHPVLPVPGQPPGTREPPRVDAGADWTPPAPPRPPPPSPTALAFDLRLPLERVRAALSRMPADVSDVAAYVREHA